MTGPNAELDHAVMEQLDKIGDINLHVAIEVLGKMIEGDTQGWRVNSWEDAAMNLLGRAMKGDDDTRSLAKQLIDRFGRRGYIEFGDLLQQTS